MRFPVFSWLLLLYSALLLSSIDEILVGGQCPEDEKSLLLQLNESLSFNRPPGSIASKLASWNTSTDYCSWEGVECDKDSGHVKGLDLSSEYITGGIDDSNSSLFKLQCLQSLNLADNYFDSEIPSGIGKLFNLSNLNLSNAGFTGQVPAEISNLTRLVSLDLSTIIIDEVTWFSVSLVEPDLRTLVRNLSGLRVLYLDGVNISANGSQWCQALSSALPKLQVLSLSGCNLLGPLDSSLAKLSFLSQIRLTLNNIAAEVPRFFEDFRNLTVLHLNSCGLQGKFPEGILQLTTLRSLDVSLNLDLHGFLPEFPPNGSLQNLILTSTSFSGSLPESIANLSLLSNLELVSCSFNGSIPYSIAELNRLDSLDLSFNSFTGLMPPLPGTLTQVNLAHNYLTGPITDTRWERFSKLVILDLSNNSFNGTIPSSLLSLPAMKQLLLNQNQFSGQLTEKNGMFSAPLLDTLDLSNNNLQGPIPLSIFELRNLSVLTLSSNNFNGTIELEMIGKLQKLTSLDLSYNSLLVDTALRNSNYAFPQLLTLQLASCKLQGFPDFLRQNQSIMRGLDLSNNQIHGQIPTWVWKIGNGSLNYLNLSFNFLDSLEQPLSDLSNSPYLYILDLRSNLLQGPMPALSSILTYLDFSNNSFQSIISFTPHLVFFFYISLSSNNLIGEIPESLCNARGLEVLDLSDNSLNGTIPSCLANMNLTVLNLRRNKFIGHIPQEFPDGCNLRTLDLNGNGLEGPLPSALAKCKALEVLNVGSNQINGSFPLWLGSFTELRVLVLRSNRFSGPIIQGEDSNGTFSKLQIIDLSSNKFRGNFPTQFLKKWTAMMVDEDGTQSEIEPEILKVEFQESSSQFYYQDTVTVTIKGLEMELTKILTVYTSIDLSNNRFQGKIPDVIGNLTALYFLNLSHNALTGGIPSSLGNLKQLESLDLSSNKLGGNIPQQLTKLTFLGVLNLSWNNLTGMIPAGSQIQTFPPASFEGNEGLCGFPLSRHCTDDTNEAPPPPPPTTKESRKRQLFGYDWRIVLSGLFVGFGGAVGIVLAFFFFSDRGRKFLFAR